jgi:hypothetical protein
MDKRREQKNAVRGWANNNLKFSNDLPRILCNRLGLGREQGGELYDQERSREFFDCLR